MSRIYVDVDAAEIAGPGAPPSLDPVAVRSLRFLGEAGNEVVLVTNGGDPPSPELRSVAAEVITSVPQRPGETSWYLTAEVERCTGASARLRTVLIGSAPPAGSIHRCDGVARDLHAAALEVLATEAMPR